MARLHEHQGKALLRQHKLAIPQGGVAATPDEARAIALELGKPVMVKAQAWVTGRASLGGIKRASTPDEAAEAAESMLGMQVKGFTVTHVLVEEQLAIKREFYAGVIVDDRFVRLVGGFHELLGLRDGCVHAGVGASVETIDRGVDSGDSFRIDGSGSVEDEGGGDIRPVCCMAKGLRAAPAKPCHRDGAVSGRECSHIVGHGIQVGRDLFRWKLI